MDIAHEEGITFFDTADRYGGEPGETETIIGNWFASGGGRRERTVIATKVYGEMGSWPNEGKWRRSGRRSRCRCRRARSSTPVVATSPAGKSYGPDQDCELLATLLATVGVGISVGSSAGLQHHGRVAGDDP